MKTPPRILHLTPREEAVRRASDLLAGDYVPCEITWVSGGEAFESALQGGLRFDLIFLDYDGPDGPPGLEAATRLNPGVPVILFCGADGEARVLEALRGGAWDYVRGDRPLRLPSMVRRALAEVRNAAARREAESANARLNSLLRAILDSTSEGILVGDLAGRITTYNRKFMSLCGIPEYILATMDMDKVIQFLVDQFQDAEAFMNEVRHLGAQSDRETQGLLKSLGDRLIEGVGRPYPQSSEAVGRVFSFRDVTDRERSAERLKLVINTQRPFLEAAADSGIALWHGTESGIVWSEAARRILGLEARDLPGTLEALGAFVHAEDSELFQGALATPPAEDVHLRLRGPGGGWTRTQWTFRRDSEGRLTGSFRDVTAAHRARQERDAGLRAQWLTDLASNFARALRTPLGTLRLHLRSLRDPDTEARQRHLDGAEGCMDALSSLLDEAARAGLRDKAPSLLLDLNQVMERLRPWAAGMAGPGITLRWDLAPDLPTLPMNPGRMEPVFMNLLQNAREALDGQGEILVRTARVPREEGGAGPSRLLLEVRDNGPGISPRVKDQMFDPYFTTRAEAKGLGLTVVRCLLDSCGGSIQVDTEPMRGTSMKVYLPC